MGQKNVNKAVKPCINYSRFCITILCIRFLKIFLKVNDFSDLKALFNTTNTISKHSSLMQLASRQLVDYGQDADPA